MGNWKARHPVSGVALGILSGFLLPFTLSIASVVMLPTVIVAVLGVWSGPIAALAATLCHLLMAFTMGEGAMVLVVAEAFLLPAWGIMILVGRRPRFGQGVAWSALMVLGAMLMLLTAAWMVVRGDLIGALMNGMRAYFDSLPGDWKDVLLAMFAQVGLLGANPGVDFARALTAAEQGMLIERLLRLLTETLQLNFVSMLLCSGVLTGASGYWLSARVCARRGDDPIIEYKPVAGWRLPHSLIIGPVACALLCYAAYGLGMSGADAAFNAFYNLGVLALSVQGLGAMDRRLSLSGVSAGYRVLLIGMMAIVGSYILCFLGAGSALIGSQGLVTQFIKRRANRNGKGDDEK